MVVCNLVGWGCFLASDASSMSQLCLARIKVLPGLHPIRIEFFWQPPDGVSATVQRPPGIKATGGGSCTTPHYATYLKRAQCLRLLVVSTS